MAKKERVNNSQRILTSKQRDFLDIVASKKYLCKHFYFTGGTPLAAFYLHHRFSDDIDLFSEREIHLPSIRSFIKEAQIKLHIQSVDYTNFLGLHSFQLYSSQTDVLKVDFNYYPFPRIEKGIIYKEIEVDGLLDIAVNKVHTIVLKPRARDFIDVYFIIKEKGYDFYELLMKAKAKFDWHIDSIQLGSRLYEAKELKDYPRMLIKINHKEWQNFFLNEAKKLKKEIFE